MKSENAIQDIYCSPPDGEGHRQQCGGVAGVESFNGHRRVKLKDVCKRITVGHVGPMADKYVKDGVPFLRSQNINPFRLACEDIKYIDSDFHKKLSKSALRPGDVAVVRTGYPGTACVIPETLEEANCADLVVITPDKNLNPYYLAAVFNSSWGKAKVAGHLVGVAQQHFNITVARELEIDLPSRKDQDRIAGILSAYDDLIENNQRRTRILEEMARSLYREWFVNFRFLGQNTGDSVVGTIADLATVEREGVNPSEYPQEEFEHYSIPAFDDGQQAIIERGETVRSTKYRINADCVLLSKLNPRIPRVWLPVPSGVRPAITSTEFLVLRPKAEASREFLYAKCCSEEFYGKFASLAIGTSTSHQRVRPETVLHLQTVIPARDAMTAFTQLAKPLLRLSHNLRLQMKNTRCTRDSLLPVLLRGQFR